MTLSSKLKSNTNLGIVMKTSQLVQTAIRTMKTREMMKMAMTMNKITFSIFLFFLTVIAGCNYGNDALNVPDVDVNDNIDNLDDDMSKDIDTMVQEEQIVTDNELDDIEKDLTNLEDINEQDNNNYEFEI